MRPWRSKHKKELSALFSASLLFSQYGDVVACCESTNSTAELDEPSEDQTEEVLEEMNLSKSIPAIDSSVPPPSGLILPAQPEAAPETSCSISQPAAPVVQLSLSATGFPPTGLRWMDTRTVESFWMAICWSLEKVSCLNGGWPNYCSWGYVTSKKGWLISSINWICLYWGEPVLSKHIAGLHVPWWAYPADRARISHSATHPWAIDTVKIKNLNFNLIWKRCSRLSMRQDGYFVDVNSSYFSRDDASLAEGILALRPWEAFRTQLSRAKSPGQLFSPLEIPDEW